jgi:hypothetical protein
MSATIKYADGRRSVECETVAEAVTILGRECEVVEECGDRWLAWATQTDADGPHGNGDDGSHAVAEIRTA